MKKIFTLLVFTSIVLVTCPQAVLNEVYPQPGNGYHEFFELYNENNAVENLDNYTLVGYYEEGGNSGFYILDLPTANMAAHGYYVGASNNPFDIQAQLGQTANFSWNSIPAGGTLSKWQKNGTSYIPVAVPADLNDLMVRIVGGGDGVYHIFLFKNGILVNGVVGGVNTFTLPSNIKSMPNLPIDMSGSSPDFTINFNSIPDNSIEFIPNSLGTNNGYFRGADGLCGDWMKSDAPGQHSPASTNGLAPNLNPANQVSISTIVSQYAGDPTKALLTYNITAGPAAAFPVTVEVYSDLGVAGQLDINDMLIDTRIITSTAAGAQYVILPTWDVSVIIVVKPASDCFNKTFAVGNYWSVLPVQLISFQGNVNASNKISLQWKVSNNKITDQFEVQRSYDGQDFRTIGLVFSSEKTDVENYMFYETISSFDKVMYRLKMIDKDGRINYSRTLVFQSKLTTANNSIKILGNPVSDQLTFSYTAFATWVIDIKVYDMSGRIVMTNKINSLEGNNMISFPLDSTFKPSMYVVEVNNGTNIQKSKFVKQ